MEGNGIFEGEMKERGSLRKQWGFQFDKGLQGDGKFMRMQEYLAIFPLSPKRLFCNMKI